MNATEYPYAGLILPDARDLDPRPYLQAARRVLARLDPHPKGGSRVSETADMVRGGVFGLRVTPQEYSDYGPRMMLEVVTKDGTPTEDEAAAQILSDTVLFALKISSADIIEWYSPDVLLDAEDFIRLRSYVSPKRARITPGAETQKTVRLGATDLVDRPAPLMLEDAIDTPTPAKRDTLSALYDMPSEELDTELVAADAVSAPTQAESRQESRITAAGWLLSGVTAIIFLPVGIAMFLVGIYRGMDFRLVTQVMVVTGLFVLLYNTDRMHSVLRQFLY